MKVVTVEKVTTPVIQSKVKYECEVCGKKYASEDKALQCESLCKNKQILKGKKPKFKVGDIISYKDNWIDRMSFEKVLAITHNCDYTEYAYRTFTYTGILESDVRRLACPADLYKKTVNKMKKDLSIKIGVPTKGIRVALNTNGSFNVEFNTDFINIVD